MESVQQICTLAYRRSGWQAVLPFWRQALQQIAYLRYLPKLYADGDAWPLVLFLHGSDERGSNLDDLKREGLTKLAHEGREFPFILIAPQCPPRRRWDAELLGALLDRVESECRVDRNRVYVTGMSMGGSGTWRLAARYPERFAAIVPICGRSGQTDARLLKHLPAWVFHGANDRVVPVRESIRMVSALRSHGSEVRFTLYPHADHDCWTETYADPQLYDWLLSIRRGRHATEGVPDLGDPRSC
ncbi:MAG: prolyl oligopeptidase family serine peptidase [Roseiflexaceae bacterium]